MYKICKTPKSEARQKEFQDTLLRMLEKQKMKDITIVSLCQEMNISRKTFYQYFDTVEDVLYIMIDKEMRNAFLLLEYNPEVGEFFEYWIKNKWLLDVLQKNEMSNLLVERAYILSDIYQRDGMSIQNMKYAGWISCIITVLLLWHHGGMQQSPDEMQKTIYDMFHLKGKLYK